MSAAGERLISAAKEALSGIKRMKSASHRDPKGGWAPGRYMCLCRQCNEHFLGDKRALVCADCAYGE